jgi:hypothetical protein
VQPVILNQLFTWDYLGLIAQLATQPAHGLQQYLMELIHSRSPMAVQVFVGIVILTNYPAGHVMLAATPITKGKFPVSIRRQVFQISPTVYLAIQLGLGEAR